MTEQEIGVDREQLLHERLQLPDDSRLLNRTGFDMAFSKAIEMNPELMKTEYAYLIGIMPDFFTKVTQLPRGVTAQDVIGNFNNNINSVFSVNDEIDSSVGFMFKEMFRVNQWEKRYDIIGSKPDSLEVNKQRVLAKELFELTRILRIVEEVSPDKFESIKSRFDQCRISAFKNESLVSSQ